MILHEDWALFVRTSDIEISRIQTKIGELAVVFVQYAARMELHLARTIVVVVQPIFTVLKVPEIKNSLAIERVIFKGKRNHRNER